MEASPRLFAPPELVIAKETRGKLTPECHSPVRKARLADTHAPAVTVPLRFAATGLIALLMGAGLLIARPDLLATYHYNQYVIATTHLFVLGFICTIVMGAMYQLVPVALETRLHSVRLARWQFIAHTLGFAGMVWMFWKWDMKEVGHFASVLALGVGWFIYNMVRTLRTIPRWNAVAFGIASSLAWLSLTILAGLFLAATKCWTFSPFDTVAAMHAHAHLGVVGVFLILIVAVSFKLVPMFALSELQSPRRAAWSLGLLNVGLLGAVTTVLIQSPLKFVFALVIVAGLVVYAVELRAILRARRRKSLDWGLKSFLTALGLLVPLSIIGTVLAWPGLPLTEFTAQLENLYGFLALVAVVGFAILGMLCKIVPFLVWYHSYSPHIGRAKVPSLGDMSEPLLLAAGYWTFLAAISWLSVAILMASEPAVRVGAILLAASLACYAGNFAAVLSHWLRPRIQPLPLLMQTTAASV
jgi:hypothetical protein